MFIPILVFGSGIAFGLNNRRYRRKLELINRSQQPKTINDATPLKLKQIYQKSINGILTVKNIFNISMSGGELRNQQLKEISSLDGGHKLETDEITLDKNIKRSIGLMSLSLAGTWFYAPLIPIAAAGTLYIFTPVFYQLFLNLRKRHISTELIEAVSVISLLVSGYTFLAVFITFTSLLCQKLLMRTEQRSRQQLISVFSQKRQSVWVIKDDAEVEIPIEAVVEKDIVVANAGEIVPVDGTIIEGMASVDQQSLTGESKAIEMEAGTKVFASSIVLAGRILIRVEKTGSNTNAAKIGLILEHTQEYKESLRLRGKHIADGFIGPTLLVSGLTLPLFGPSAAIAIIWSAFGYNMKLYGPISVLNFLHIMAKNGILIKDGRSLEMLQKVDTLIFDKTGTLTMEQPILASVHPLDTFDEETLLSYAAAAEYRQTHPIAKAILAAANKRELDVPIIEQAAYQIGYGIEVKIKSKAVHVGSARYMEQQGILIEKETLALKTNSNNRGYTLVYVAVNNTLAGVLELHPRIRPEAKEIVDHLKARGVSVHIISGDHEQPTRKLAHELGIDHYSAETLPDQKANIIAKLRARGKFVAYVGDGINDAIALKQANVSISLRGASTIATDTAQIILMDGDLKKLKPLFAIASSFEANMRTNYLNSMVPGVITLAGVFFFHMGLAGGMGVYFISKIVGLSNVMLPLLRHENRESSLKERPVLNTALSSR